MRKSVTVAIVVLGVLISVAPGTFAGPGLNCPWMCLSIDSTVLDEGATIAAYVNGSSQPESSSRLYTGATDGSTDYGYWFGDDGLRYRSLSLDQADANGDRVFQAIIGAANDDQGPRTFYWYLQPQEYTWFVMVHSKDSHALVFARLIRPYDEYAYGTFTTAMSGSGYDVLAAAFIDSPAVPEPASLLALGLPLFTLLGRGFVCRRR